MSNENTPYANLDPCLILDAIDSVGYKCNGSLLALNSYENRVYQIGVDDSTTIIAKFYRPNRWIDDAILEEHQFEIELAEHEIPVIAPIIVEGKTLHEFKDYRFALFPRKGGRTLELDNLEHLEWMGRFIARLHAVGSCQPFKHRLKLDVQNYGHIPYQFLLDHNFIPADLKKDYSLIVEALLSKITECFLQVDAKYIRLHGDCHAGNVLWNNEGPQIVDLDDCLMGPAIQDIWMLLTGNTPHEVEVQLNHILRGYQEFHDFNFRELQLIEPLRALRMLHYSAWLAKRWQDPTFPLNFPWFNTSLYWQEQLNNLNEQLLILNQESDSSINQEEDW